jgi:hypothetical protein
MLFKKYFALTMMLCFAGIAHAQNWPFEVWHEGKIVLLQGDTLRGLVKYDLQKDLVQHTVQDSKAEVYTARKVIFFEIFDESVKKYRQFFALPYTTAGGYKSPIFFELLEEGNLTLLSREFLENKTFSSPYYTGSYSRIVLTNKYFFMKEDGEIVEFNGSKKDLLDMMGKRSEEVEKFMKSNRLRFDEKYDFARIVAYYNSLSGS